MYKAIAEEKRVQDSCDSNNSGDSSDKDVELDEVSSRENMSGSAGNSGGLITMWDATVLELLDKRVGLNSISCLFKYRSNGFKFIPTNAYSPCDDNLREDFWSDLAEIRNWSLEPWCFVGELNSVRSDAERNKSCGDARNIGYLNEFIFEQEMIDFPLNGSSYTWRNKQDDPLLCRLDSYRLVLRPIIVLKWLKHPDFVKSVEQWWKDLVFVGMPGYILFCELQNLKYFIKNWSKEVFGNVKKEENDLTEKIKSLNLLEESVALSSIQLEERANVLVKLNNVKVNRARSAFQRAKVKGFKEGDKNTRYFNKIANAKRRRNCITKLEVAGVDVFNQEIIKREIQQYSSSLFTASSSVNPSFENMAFKSIDDSQKVWLERPFDEEKVMEDIKKCGANKAPGPDGYNLELYKACWGFTKHDVMAVVNAFHNKG
ncbi:uncharacterized protein LOC113352215 [Papaver somniferum]|uniref:uncharacterized protein LOC113352215 n=1 Tax=Papaver somniferum TaxID=3469 RepID=UPI000E6FA195|nr:uncharacterized protein LOC113352215 [Papaver somniferum]